MKPVDFKSRPRLETILIVLLTGLFAADLCFIGTTLFEGCDYIEMWRPVWNFFTSSLGEGTLPLWNPYIGLGRPFIADMQNTVFYPPIVLLFFGQPLGPFLLVWLHGLIAVFGMLRLCRAMDVGRVQSYFATVCLLFSGAFTARWMTGQLPYCWALCYTPWLFYCAIQTSAVFRWKRVGIYASVLALQFLCGNPQVFWFCTVSQAAFILGRDLQWPLHRMLLDTGRSFSHFGIALAWCFGLVAVIFLPFLELVGEGNRDALSRDFSNLLRLDWANLNSLFFPIGSSRHYDWINWELNLFIGTIAVVLGIIGLSRVSEKNVRGWLAALIVCLLIALAGNSPAFEFFYRTLPGFASFRCHSRAGFIVVFALISGAAICLSRPQPWLRFLPDGKFARSSRYLFIAICLVQGADLLRGLQQIKAAYTFQHVLGYSSDFPARTPFINLLEKMNLMQSSQPPPRVAVPDQVLPINDAMDFRYGTFDADFSLFLKRPWIYLHRMAGLKPSEFLNNSLDQQIYKLGPFPYRDLALSAGLDPVQHEFCLNTNPSPREFLVYAAKINPDINALLTTLANGHEVHQVALLENPVRDFSLANFAKEKGLPVAIKQFNLNSISAEVDARQNGLLILAEAWYPGWRAEIDGQDHDCLPANFWMRAVPITPGHHVVRFHFHQNYLMPGVVISALSLGVLIFVLIRARRMNSTEAIGELS